MLEIIDLSQEIFSGMAVHKSQTGVDISLHSTHEEWEGVQNPKTITPSSYKLSMGEHTGTHVDALNHMRKENIGQSVDLMPLSMFYTEAFCLDFSHKGLNELIDADEIIKACSSIGMEVNTGDTILIHTDHYRKNYETDNWSKGPGITADAAEWLGKKKVAAFGVETMSPGVSGISNNEVHLICGKIGFTHYENLINLHLLVGRGRFRFIGFPLKIKGGTGSPVRAVAIFE